MSELKYNKELQYHYNEEYIFFSKSIFSQWYGGFNNQQGSFVTYVPGFSSVKVNCAEQAMMIHKAALFYDAPIFEEIMKTSSPKEQKDLGRKVRGFNQKVWDENCFNIVTRVNIEKFFQNKTFRDILMDTGDRVLVEAAPWDKVWGIGMGVDDLDILDKSKWKGKNFLGFALTETKKFFKEIKGEL